MNESPRQLRASTLFHSFLTKKQRKLVASERLLPVIGSAGTRYVFDLAINQFYAPAYRNLRISDLSLATCDPDLVQLYMQDYILPRGVLCNYWEGMFYPLYDSVLAAKLLLEEDEASFDKMGCGSWCYLRGSGRRENIAALLGDAHFEEVVRGV